MPNYSKQSLASQRIKPGAILMGRVVEVGTDVVLVNAGLKCEAVIPVEQFKNERGEIEVDVGDDVEVALDSVEDGSGETRLSREKAKRARTWSRLEQAFEKQEIVKGIINGRVKGGFTVEIDFVRAFLPGSLVDVRPVRDPSYLEGKALEFKVIKLDQKRNNVVVSRRAVVEQEYSAERTELLEKLQEGAVVKGVVKNLTDYGAFVDLGGIDGLLHITDMAWKRVKHPSEVVNVGDEIDVRILKFDRERTARVARAQAARRRSVAADRAVAIRPARACSARSRTSPTTAASSRSRRASKAWCTCPRWTGPTRTSIPSKVVHIGQEVEVMVLDIDEERRRISLGIKQCQANPWKEFADNYNRGDKVAGQIKSITDFGIFIGLSGGIDGLVHLSDISWDVPGEEAVRNYQKGQQVEAMVLSIDPERERISLGIKQLAKDPFSAWICRASEGHASSRAWCAKWTPRARSSTSAAASKVTCAPPSCRAIASKTRARCSRSATRSKPSSPASIARAARSRCRSRRRRAHEEAEAVQNYRTGETSTGTSLGDLLKEHIGGQD